MSVLALIETKNGNNYLRTGGIRLLMTVAVRAGRGKFGCPQAYF